MESNPRRQGSFNNKTSERSGPINTPQGIQEDEELHYTGAQYLPQQGRSLKESPTIYENEKIQLKWLTLNQY